jgi:hypothetical protein
LEYKASFIQLNLSDFYQLALKVIILLEEAMPFKFKII